MATKEQFDAHLAAVKAMQGARDTFSGIGGSYKRAGKDKPRQCVKQNTMPFVREAEVKPDGTIKFKEVKVPRDMEGKTAELPGKAPAEPASAPK